MSIKNNNRILLTGICLLLISFSVSAQNEVKTLNAIIKKMYKELGGVVIVSQSSISVQGFEISIDSKIYKKDDKTRTESTINGIPGQPGPMESIAIANGDDFWVITAERGKEKMDKNNPMARLTKSAFETEVPDSAKFIKSEKVGERDCYVFESTNNTPYGKTISQLWFDKKTAVLVKLESQTPQGKSMMKVDEYKLLKGKWEIPNKISATLEGAPLMFANITSIETDQKLSDDLFNADKAEVK